jgi:hypothetical protein
MHIHHLTLTTGHTRFSPRSEVAQWAIDFIKPVVIVGGGELGDTGWRIRMVRGTQPGGAAFECHHGSTWFVSCYMAWTKAGSVEMWNAAKSFPLVVPHIRRPPSLPWLAAGIMPEAIDTTRIDLMMEVGDLERVVAWTVLDLYRDEVGEAA